jgi:hypothetical protein
MPTLHHGVGESSVSQLIKRLIFPNSKFRIVCRDHKFVPQEFLGIWKLGLYADIAKEFNLSEYIPFQFEHENISEAELVIEHRKKQLNHKKYVVRDYYQV